MAYSNLGASDSYASATWQLHRNNGVFTNASAIAASFTPAVTNTLVSAEAAVFYNGSTADQTYFFSLAADNAGQLAR